MTFAQRLTLPIAFLAMLFLYLAWEVNPGYAKWLVPCLVLLVVLFFSAPQLNWWWWQRNPPDLQPNIAAALQKYFPFYQKLDDVGKRKFRARVFLVVEGTEWIAKDFPDDEMPPDVQLPIAAAAAAVTFHRPDNDFLLKKFEKVVVYPRPFMSPDYPFPHDSELFEPDGCLIFSAEQIMSSFVQPLENYNPAFHEFAKATFLNWPEMEKPNLPDTPETWEKLEKISGLSREKVEKTIGLADLDVWAVALHHYFVFGQKLEV